MTQKELVKNTLDAFERSLSKRTGVDLHTLHFIRSQYFQGKSKVQIIHLLQESIRKKEQALKVLPQRRKQSLGKAIAYEMLRESVGSKLQLRKHILAQLLTMSSHTWNAILVDDGLDKETSATACSTYQRGIKM